MDNNFPMLHKEEALLARILLKNKFITEDILKKYLDFLEDHNTKGKTYLGKILVDMGYIADKVLKEFVDESNKLHLEFCQKLQNDGYLTKKQLETIEKKHRESGQDIITLLVELDIMTRDNFARIYEKSKQQGILRLGEWLVLEKKVTSEQIEKAREVQKVSSLADFLVHNKYISTEVMDKVLSRVSVG